jgi:pimeloyl-ACP methyl ester carboxylesterase
MVGGPALNDINKHPIPELVAMQEIYEKEPTDELLKKLTLISTPYIFTKAGLSKDISFLNALPYNSEVCEWSEKHFDQTYKAQWIPTNMPTLIFAGEHDMMTPLTLFSSSQGFQNSLITLATIPNAGHFPWIENPEAVVSLFKNYSNAIKI